MQLVRGLVINATYGVGPTATTGGGGGGGGVTGAGRQSSLSSSTTVLNHLLRVFGKKSVTATIDMTGASSAPHTLLGMGMVCDLNAYAV